MPGFIKSTNLMICNLSKPPKNNPTFKKKSRIGIWRLNSVSFFLVSVELVFWIRFLFLLKLIFIVSLLFSFLFRTENIKKNLLSKNIYFREVFSRKTFLTIGDISNIYFSRSPISMNDLMVQLNKCKLIFFNLFSNSCCSSFLLINPCSVWISSKFI